MTAESSSINCLLPEQEKELAVGIRKVEVYEGMFKAFFFSNFHLSPSPKMCCN